MASSKGGNIGGEALQVYNSRINLLAQLQEQGYNVQAHIGISMSDVSTLITNGQLDMLLHQENKNIYVKYHDKATLSRANIDAYRDEVFSTAKDEVEEGKLNPVTDELMIIIKTEPNDTIKERVKYIWENERIFIIIININRLQYNVLTHALQPRHEPISEEEAQAVKVRYNISDNSQFPDISRFNPVAQAIGLRPGQLCKIYRPSKTAIFAEVYRICS
jgi:DNA-directed RNA polymerase subunit H (RpoH/RPB5)